jgi:hypothetical protein
MMPHRRWNESSASGELPWVTGEPEPLLVEFVAAGRVRPTQTLEIGGPDNCTRGGRLHPKQSTSRDDAKWKAEQEKQRKE